MRDMDGAITTTTKDCAVVQKDLLRNALETFSQVPEFNKAKRL